MRPRVAERIVLATDLSEVSRLNAWLADLFGRARPSGEVAEALKLCLNEIVANTISYAYPDGRDGRIEIAVEPGDKRWWVEIRDDGAPFDPLAAPLAEPIHDLESARIGGFGIKLFRENSSDRRYARADGWNVLSFRCP